MNIEKNTKISYKINFLKSFLSRVQAVNLSLIQFKFTYSVGIQFLLQNFVFILDLLTKKANSTKEISY